MPIPPPSTNPSPPATAAAATAVYLPRDVVNAPEVKAAIARRSAERGDDADMAAWLLNHFFRWAIGSFGNVLPVQSVADYLAAAGPGKPMPEWLAKQLQPPPRAAAPTATASTQDKDKSKGGKAESPAAEAAPKSFYYLDPEHLLLVDRERMLVEFLRSRRGTRLEQKLQRITCFMAMAMWEQEHQRMQAKRNKGWVPSSGLALKELLRTPNGVIFEFVGSHAALREEMAYESFHMQHCLGQFANIKKLNGGYGEQYATAAQNGRLRLFTLRSAGNLPHVTISLEVHADGLRVDQIKGKQNRHPVRKYADDVLQFLRTLPPRGERHSDCEGMGLVFEPETADDATRGQWKFVTDVQSPDFLLSVMSGNFHLIEHFEQPPPALQWLLLRIAPHELARLRQMDVAVAAAARLTLPANRLPPSLQAAPADATGAPGASAAMMEIEGISLSAAVCAPPLGAASP